MDKKIILVGVGANLNDVDNIFDNICTELACHGVAYGASRYTLRIETSNCVIEAVNNDGGIPLLRFDKFVNPPQNMLTCIKREGKYLRYSDLISYVLTIEHSTRLNKNKVNYSSYYKKRKELEIEKVKFNSPATIVWWKDGTKTVVKCSDEEKFDAEKGLAMAICKKALGNQGNYYNVFKEWVPEVENKDGNNEEKNVGSTLDIMLVPVFANIAKGMLNALSLLYGTGEFTNVAKELKEENNENKQSVSAIMSGMCNHCEYYNVEHTKEPCASCQLHNHWKRRTNEISCADCIHSEKEFYEEPCYHCEHSEYFEPKDEEKKEEKEND